MPRLHIICVSSSVKRFDPLSLSTSKLSSRVPTQNVQTLHCTCIFFLSQDLRASLHLSFHRHRRRRRRQFHDLLLLHSLLHHHYGDLKSISSTRAPISPGLLNAHPWPPTLAYNLTWEFLCSAITKVFVLFLTLTLPLLVLVKNCQPNMEHWVNVSSADLQES